jgi:hypothetical protein
MTMTENNKNQTNKKKNSPPKKYLPVHEAMLILDKEYSFDNIPAKDKGVFSDLFIKLLKRKAIEDLIINTPMTPEFFEFKLKSVDTNYSFLTAFDINRFLYIKNGGAFDG